MKRAIVIFLLMIGGCLCGIGGYTLDIYKMLIGTLISSFGSGMFGLWFREDRQ